MTAREAVCDAAAMRLTGASAIEYGRLLIRIPSSFGLYQSAGALYATGAYVDTKRRITLIKRFYQGTPHAAQPILQALGVLAALCLIPWWVEARLPRHPADTQIRYSVIDLGSHSPDAYPNLIRGITASGIVYEWMRKDVISSSLPHLPTSTLCLWVWDSGVKSEFANLRFEYTRPLSTNNQGQLTGMDNTGRSFVIEHGQARFLDRGIKNITPAERASSMAALQRRYEMLPPDVTPMNELAVNALGQRLVTCFRRTPGRENIESFGCLIANGKASILGHLPGDTEGEAAVLNNNGLVAGLSYRTEAETTLRGYQTRRRGRIVFWHEGEIANLGALPGDGEGCIIALNDNSQIIGFTDKIAIGWPVTDQRQVQSEEVREGNSQPFLYSGGSLYNLNDLLPANSGWQIDQPVALNNAGQIIGYGTYHGADHYFLLSPAWRAFKGSVVYKRIGRAAGGSKGDRLRGLFGLPARRREAGRMFVDAGPVCLLGSLFAFGGRGGVLDQLSGGVAAQTQRFRQSGRLLDGLREESPDQRHKLVRVGLARFGAGRHLFRKPA